MYRLASFLASLAMISLPACKRDRGGPSEPDATSSPSQSSMSTSTPTPEQVCVRLAEIAGARLGHVDSEVQRQEVASCSVDMSLVQQARGPEGWDGLARCVVMAQSEDEMRRCDELHPAPGVSESDASTPEGVTPEDQVCMLMISTFAMELALEAQANGQPPPKLEDTDILRAHSECLRSLEQARQARSGPEYESLLACLAAGTSSPQLDQCMSQ